MLEGGTSCSRIVTVWICFEEKDETGTERLEDLGTESVFGSHLYEWAMSGDHFLRKLEEVMDWEMFTPKLVRL